VNRSQPRDLGKALEKLLPAKQVFFLTRGQWIVSTDLEVGKDIRLKLGKDATISVAKGKVLTVRGLFEAPATRIFDDDGEVVFDADFRQRVYPQWWGAKGNGLVEDTGPVQAAISSFSIKGGEIFFPDGTYILDAIGVKSDIAMSGNGAYSVLKQKSGAKFCVSTNPANRRIKRADLNPANITFSDLTFRGTVDTDGFSAFLILLDIRGSSKVSISRCSFIGFRGDGIYLGELNVAGINLHNSNITISECVFDGINRDNRNGISVIDCDGLVIEKCRFMNCSRPDMPGAIDVEPDEKHDIVRNIKIKENRFDNIGGNNIIQISITFALAKLNNTMQNIEISANTIEGDGSTDGIYIGQPQYADAETPSNNIFINNNLVRNTKRAFMVFGVKGVEMIDNIFDGCDYYPFISYSKKNINVRDMKVIGNMFRNLSKKDGAGISVFGSYNLEFNSNIFDNIGKSDGTSGNALFFRRHGGPVDYVTIENNTFKGENTKVAIQREVGNITYPEHNRISGNIFLSENKMFLPALNP
jgi:hypothetical protein